MAKYHGSPFGIIRGSIGNITASKARGGVLYIKIKPYPTHRGSKKFIKQNIKDKKTRNKISAKQANTIRIFTLTSKITHLLRPIIYENWEPQTRGTPITGHNKFTKYNFLPVYFSIPNLKLIISKENKPDISKLTVTMGRLEPAYIEKVETKQNEIKVQWNSFYYHEADPEDSAIITAIYYTPHNNPVAILPKELKVEIFRDSAKRKDKSATIQIKKTKNLSLFLSFVSKNKPYRFSNSIHIPLL